MNDKTTITIYIMWFASLALCFVTPHQDMWWALAHLIICTVLVFANGIFKIIEDK